MQRRACALLQAPEEDQL